MSARVIDFAAASLAAHRSGRRIVWPACYACGRPVVGHVPSGYAGSRPCCSVECARRGGP